MMLYKKRKRGKSYKSKEKTTFAQKKFCVKFYTGFNAQFLKIWQN